MHGVARRDQEKVKCVGYFAGGAYFDWIYYVDAVSLYVIFSAKNASVNLNLSITKCLYILF